MTPEEREAAIRRYQAAEQTWWSNTCDHPGCDEAGWPTYWGIRHPDSPASKRARRCDAPVRPGAANAAAAYRTGCEDEWIDRMSASYGGEW